MKTTDNYKIGDRVQNIATGATGTIDNFLIDDDGKRTYIVKYDEMQRRPDSFEYQNEEVFAEEIELAPFFIAGKKYRCIQDVKMKKGGEVAFKVGNIYEQANDPTKWCGWLRNEQGGRHNQAADLVTNQNARDAINAAKHEVYEVFKAVNQFLEDPTA